MIFDHLLEYSVALAVVLLYNSPVIALRVLGVVYKIIECLPTLRS